MPLPQTCSSPSVLLPGGHPTQGEGCPAFVRCPSSWGPWKSALVEHGIFPSLAVRRTQTPLCPDTLLAWGPRQPVTSWSVQPRLRALINVGQRRKETTQGGKRKGRDGQNSCTRDPQNGHLSPPFSRLVVHKVWWFSKCKFLGPTLDFLNQKLWHGPFSVS